MRLSGQDQLNLWNDGNNSEFALYVEADEEDKVRDIFWTPPFFLLQTLPLNSLTDISPTRDTHLFLSLAFSSPAAHMIEYLNGATLHNITSAYMDFLKIYQSNTRPLQIKTYMHNPERISRQTMAEFYQKSAT